MNWQKHSDFQMDFTDMRKFFIFIYSHYLHNTMFNLLCGCQSLHITCTSIKELLKLSWTSHFFFLCYLKGVMKFLCNVIESYSISTATK